MSFFHDNSYHIVRMMLYQFGMMVFGLILTTAASSNVTLLFMVSLYATLFYMVLLYTTTWECGAKDRIRADAGYVRLDRFAGIKMSLWANLPNFLIVLLLAVGYLFGALVAEEGWAQAMFAIAHAVGIIWEAMYTGAINLALDPAATSSLSPLYILAYALTPLPALAASAFGYAMGIRDRRIFAGRGKKDGDGKKKG